MNDYAITNISNHISRVLWTPVKKISDADYADNLVAISVNLFDFEIFLDV